MFDQIVWRKSDVLVNFENQGAIPKNVIGKKVTIAFVTQVHLGEQFWKRGVLKKKKKNGVHSFLLRKQS